MTRSTLHLSFLSDPALIKAVRCAVEGFAEVAGLSAVAVGDVGLCVNEALANVIRHAYDDDHRRPVELDASFDADRLTLHLRDWGNGEKPEIGDALDSGTPPTDATLRPGGLGLPCLRRLLDQAVFEPQPDGMLLRMLKIKRPDSR